MSAAFLSVVDQGRLVLKFSRRFLALPPAAATEVTTLIGLVARVDELEAARAAARSEARKAMSRRHHAGAGLEGRLRDLARLATVTARRVNEPALRIRIQTGRTRRCTLPVQTRTAITIATEHLKVLLRFGLPGDLLAKLEEDLSTWEAAQQCREQARSAGAVATAELRRTVRAIAVSIRQLDALYRMLFAKNPATLAEWDVVWSGRTSAVSAAPAVEEREPVTEMEPSLAGEPVT